LGNLFQENQEGNTWLTAYIFRGEKEIDPDGKLTYTWYTQKEGSDPEIVEGFKSKAINIPIQNIINKNVYFEAE
jgi:hypothetical protein